MLGTIKRSLMRIIWALSRNVPAAAAARPSTIAAPASPRVAGAERNGGTMPRIARATDEHRGTCGHGFSCCPHGVVGTIVQGSPNVSANGLQVARLGDGVAHDCPHCGTGFVSSASATVKANGTGVARLGDSATYPGGGGTITTASPDVNAGG